MYLGGHIGQLKLDGLVLGDGDAKGLPLLGVTDSGVEGGLGHAHGPGRNVNPPGLQAAHDLAKPPAFLAANQVLGRYPEVLENQLAGIQPPIAHLVQVTAYPETRIALFHNESANTLVIGLRVFVGPGQQAKSVTVAAVGDKAFGAVDDVLFTIFHGGGLQVCHVGAATGLGQGQPPPFLARRQVWKKAVLLLFGAVVGEHVGEDVVGTDGPTYAHEALAELLEDGGEGGVVQAQSTVFLGNGYSE